MQFDFKFIKNVKFRQYFLASILTGILISMIWTHQDWRTANRSSAGISPNPREYKEAVVEVFAARTINWRGYLSVHSWIATKEKNASSYKTYQVMGWNLYFSGNAVSVREDIPDRYWFGAKPVLIQELRGQKAEKAIAKINQVVEEYPFKTIYKVWPGPNSNTFISHIIREVPELTVELPSNAVGKDWLVPFKIFAPSESGTGWQVSILGIFGVTIGKAEGLEINLLGMAFGIDFLNPAIKLPFIGRIGVKDKPFSQK